MPLNRDSLANDSFKQQMLDEAPGEMDLMDPEKFEASRQAILAEAERTGELWVFAYGSLIWNPIIDVAEMRPARLNGHSRRFCVWAPIGRGSPECMGLWLALDEGGVCDGMALRIEREKWESETLMLWRREMISAVYRPAWLTLEMEDGPRPSCVFLANPDHGRYAHEIERDAKVKAIAHAEGSLGTCREYLDNLAEGLARAEMSDPYIEGLVADVAAAWGDAQ
jgi:cation transport protein ChaC